MRIALFTDGIYPYVIGGMQRHSFYLAKYLASRGHQVDLYHFNQSDHAISELELFSPEEKANIHPIVIEWPSQGKSFGHYMKESYEYSRRILRAYRKQAAVDFIYAKGFTAWELLNRKRRGEKFPPVGVNFHGYEMFQKSPSAVEWLKAVLLLRGPAKFSVQNADYVFSYGGRITDVVRSLNVSPDKIVEIPAGITPDWMSNEITLKDKTRFVFLGRFERRKGLRELYAALRMMRKADYEFNFIGDIPTTQRIAGDRYVYHGKVTDNTALRTLLSSSNVLVCPSISEGMPNVILEAMASGLAVIATDTGATSVAVNSKNGWLVEPGNTEALKAALEAAVTASPEELKAKGLAAREDIAKKFLWEIIGRSTEAALEKVIVKE